MKSAVLVVMMLAATAAGASDWTAADARFELGYAAVAIADAFTTADIRNHDDIEEVAPLTRQVLGKNPEPLPTAAYFTAAIAAHYGVSRALPKPWRRYWQVTTITVQSAVVANNIRIGLRFGF